MTDEFMVFKSLFYYKTLIFLFLKKIFDFLPVAEFSEKNI